MREIYFIRHAKSSWSEPHLDDINRKLNNRGKRDAPFMADMTVLHGKKPDMLITSPARRAFDTANVFRKAHQLAKDNLKKDPRMYMASSNTILEVVKELPVEFAVVYLFGHNPGMTTLANYFSKEYIDNVPTCGILKVKCDIGEWLDIHPSRCTVEAFWYPKMFSQS